MAPLVVAQLRARLQELVDEATARRQEAYEIERRGQVLVGHAQIQHALRMRIQKPTIFTWAPLHSSALALIQAPVQYTHRRLKERATSADISKHHSPNDVPLNGSYPKGRTSNGCKIAGTGAFASRVAGYARDLLNTFAGTLRHSFLGTNQHKEQIRIISNKTFGCLGEEARCCTRSKTLIWPFPIDR